MQNWAEFSENRSDNSILIVMIDVCKAESIVVSWARQNNLTQCTIVLTPKEHTTLFGSKFTATRPSQREALKSIYEQIQDHINDMVTRYVNLKGKLENLDPALVPLTYEAYH